MRPLAEKYGNAQELFAMEGACLHQQLLWTWPALGFQNQCRWWCVTLFHAITSAIMKVKCPAKNGLHGFFLALQLVERDKATVSRESLQRYFKWAWCTDGHLISYLCPPGITIAPLGRMFTVLPSWFSGVWHILLAHFKSWYHKVESRGKYRLCAFIYRKLNSIFAP